jgi:hypothetical protein
LKDKKGEGESQTGGLAVPKHDVPKVAEIVFCRAGTARVKPNASNIIRKETRELVNVV